jgi:hypothetical protein
MLPVDPVMASDVLAPLPVVVITPGTEVSLPGVLVLLLDPQAERPARMLREMVAGTMMRLIMMYWSFVWGGCEGIPARTMSHT